MACHQSPGAGQSHARPCALQGRTGQPGQKKHKLDLKELCGSAPRGRLMAGHLSEEPSGPGGWSCSVQATESQGRAQEGGITSSCGHPTTHLHCAPLMLVCCSPPAASSSPVRPSGTCCNCTPVGRERGEVTEMAIMLPVHLLPAVGTSPCWVPLAQVGQPIHHMHHSRENWGKPGETGQDLSH